MNYINRYILTVTFFSILSLVSCKNEKVQGITIGVTLRENQSYSENIILSDLIDNTLAGSKGSLKKLIYFDCGDGSGCYDLGFIIVKIIDKVGEPDFNTMIKDFNSKDLLNLKGLIEVGLMYSYRGPDESHEFNDIEKHFSIVSKTINTKTKKAGL